MKYIDQLEIDEQNINVDEEWNKDENGIQNNTIKTQNNKN